MPTTIKLQSSTKHRLDRFREYKNESYDEILNKLAAIAENLPKNPELSSEAVEAIRAARKRLQEGRFISEVDAKRRLGM